jgi:hypothetical protein
MMIGRSRAIVGKLTISPFVSVKRNDCQPVRLKRMHRFFLAIAVSGLLLLFTAATLLVARPDLLAHAHTAGDPFAGHRAGR